MLDNLKLSSNERQEKVAKVMKLDMDIRGSYLVQVIHIEQLVKDIISYHFCSDENRRKELVSIILNGSSDYTFASGIEILQKILDIHYNDLTKRYPKLVNDLHNVRKFRTVLAHSMLDTSDGLLAKNYTDRIRLLSYDEIGQTNQRDITRSEMDERLEDCVDIHFDLMDIHAKIRDRVLTNAE
jgi:hypothetical protein